MLILNTHDSAEVYPDSSQKSKMKLFTYQKLVRISSNYIKFSKKRIKTFITIEMFKRKRSVSKHFMLLVQLIGHSITRNTRADDTREDPRTRPLRRTLSLSILNRSLSQRTLNKTL